MKLFSYSKKLANDLAWHLVPASRTVTSKTSLWIVGPPHSGTSITWRILSQHPQIHSVIGETGLVVKSPLIAFREFLLWTKCASSSSSYILEKTPLHVLYIDRLLKVNTNSKILICIRKPSQNYFSILMKQKKLLESDPSKYQILLNQLYSRYVSILEAIRLHGQRIYILRLENMIDQPSYVIENILNWLDLSNSSELVADMLNYVDESKKIYPFSGLTPDVVDQNLEGESDSLRESNHDLRRDLQINSPLYTKQSSLTADCFTFMPSKLKQVVQTLDSLFNY